MYLLQGDAVKLNSRVSVKCLKDSYFLLPKALPWHSLIFLAFIPMVDENYPGVYTCTTWTLTSDTICTWMYPKLHPDPCSLFGNEGMSYLKQSGPFFMLYNDTLQLRAFKTLGPSSAVLHCPELPLTPARVLYKWKRHNWALNQHFFYCWGLNALVKRLHIQLKLYLWLNGVEIMNIDEILDVQFLLSRIENMRYLGQHFHPFIFSGTISTCSSLWLKFCGRN